MLEGNFLKKLWRISNPPIFKLIVALGFSLINTGVALITPLYIKDLMDQLSKEFSFKLLVPIILLFSIEIIATAISIYLLSFISQKMVKNLRGRTMEQLIFLPMNYHKKHKSGETVSRITNDTSYITFIFSSGITELISNALLFIGSIIILFTLDVPMTLVLLMSIPITVFIILPMGNRMNKLSFEHQEKLSTLTADLTEILSEISLIKSHTNEHETLNKSKKIIHDLFSISMKKSKVEAIFSPLISTAISAIFMAVIVFGSYRIGQGFISSGELVAFIIYLFQIVLPITSVAKFFTDYQSAKGASTRIFEILATKTESEKNTLDSDQLDFKEAMNQDLNLVDVSFSYDNKSIFNNLNLTIPANKTTAIVGSSGAGKSTLLSLIERFYDTTEGDILLGNQVASKIDLYKWRSLFSYVSQEFPIISGSVRDNITYGFKEPYSDEDIVLAAQQANAHEFILQMQDGYDTLIGERGSNLSGGQRQRIALARAFMSNSPFILLDEVTANLDNDSEEKIKESLKALFTQRTSIIVAHRLSTIKDADQIVVMEQGSIVGIGTHKELSKTNAYYKKLIKSNSLEELETNNNELIYT